MTKKMIFHHPEPIATTGKSGSQVRPLRMIEAFQKIGYHVEIVAGYAAERKHAITKILQQLKEGQIFDFLYMESSTTPTLLTEKHHLPTYPILDFSFIRKITQHDIPVGLFYRDAYWRFPQYHFSTPWHTRFVTSIFYWYDWFQYLRWVDHLFLPSLTMKNVLPKWSDHPISALPPGGVPTKYLSTTMRNQKPSRLQLFYVGGITPPLYDLKPMTEVVKTLDDVSLTICCHKEEWEKNHSYYSIDTNTQVEIIHAQGEQLETYYANANLFVLMRQSNPYLDFAMPVKVFETLGYGLPIITTSGTEVARFVEKTGIGWLVSSQDEFRELLTHLQQSPDEIRKKRQRIKQIQPQHTWAARAQTVAATLSTSKSQ